MDVLFHAHSGLRYLVLLAGAVAALWLLASWFARRPYRGPGRILVAVFLGVLDLQVVIGFALFLAGFRPPGIHGHMTLMLLAAVAGHVASAIARRRVEPRVTLPLSGVLLALTLVVGGILAIRDSIF